jgi:hypothetical protein
MYSYLISEISWRRSTIYEKVDNDIVAYLLKARTVEPEKQPLLGNFLQPKVEEL